jgi:hypothetical protein
MYLSGVFAAIHPLLDSTGSQPLMILPALSSSNLGELVAIAINSYRYKLIHFITLSNWSWLIC